MSRPKRRLKKTNEDDDYIDFGMLGKGFIFLGVILLFVYFFMFLLILTVPEEAIWDDAFVGANEILAATTLPGIILIIIGGLLYFFHIQFVKLGEFAAEVESGEFERKLAEEACYQESETRGRGSETRD